MDQKEEKDQVIDLQEHRGKKSKTSNPEKLFPFDYVATERRTRWNAERYQGKWYNRKDWRTVQVAPNFGRHKGDTV